MGSMLNLQTTGDNDLTMSSREISSVTGAPHESVLKTVRRLIAEGIVSGNETPYQHPQNGQCYTEFWLSFRDTMVVASGYSAELRARIIDRWQALEAVPAVPAPAVPQSFAAALRLAAEQQDVIDAQAAQLAAAAPAVEFVERYADSTGTKGFRQVAKLLGAKENLFREFLIEQKILYRLGSELTPHAQHIDAGRFCVKAGTAGSGHAFNSARFTPKGVTWVAGEWAKHLVVQRQTEVAHAA
jgi:phage antirepressor YoqD-like protein